MGVLFALLGAALCFATGVTAAPATQDGHFRVAGYLDTALTASRGGNLQVFALSEGFGPTTQVELAYEGIPTGVALEAGSDSLSILNLPIPSGAPAGRLLLELMESGASAASWPYLSVEDRTLPLQLDPECNPFATSEFCIFPYPSSYFEVADLNTATGVRVNYPQSGLWVDTNVPMIDLGPTNTADGCSPAGPLLLHFGVDINATWLIDQRTFEKSLAEGSPIALFDLESGLRLPVMTEMDMNRKDAYPDRYALIIRPMVPMETGHRHLVALTQDLRDTEGKPLTSPIAFEALREGISTTSPVLEGMRPRFETYFTFLENKGYPRSNLLLAWDFMVASEEYVTGPIREMRQQLFEEVEARDLNYTITKITEDPNEFTALLVEGTFQVPSYLNGQSEIEYTRGYHPIRQPHDDPFPFTMIVPKVARERSDPLPLVVFGHGIFGSGRSYLGEWGLDRFSELANRGGAILIATDWIGMSKGDLELILTQVTPNLNRITLVTDRLQQSLINTLAMTELAVRQLSKDPALAVAQGQDLIDGTNVAYFGVSLGGIQGSSFVTLSPRIRRGVLAVPGCGWLNMLTRSVNWNMIKPSIDRYYPDPLLQQIGIAFFQTRFDHSDPINITRHLFRNPLPDVPSGKQVILQEAIGDSQVPNFTTEMLARAIGAKILFPGIYPVWGVEEVEAPITEPATLAQFFMVDKVERNPPPDNNTPPRRDNGVHSGILELDAVLDQTFHFLETGEVAQYCDGPCDPE